MAQTVIFGASSQGRVILETLRDQNIGPVSGFLDDNPTTHGTTIDDIPVLGGMAWAVTNSRHHLQTIVGIGNNEVRTALSSKLQSYGIEMINAIHPSAVIRGGVTLGKGSLIAAGAVIITGTRLEDWVVINTGTCLDHDCVVHTGAYVSPGVRTAGSVSIGQGAFIGTGATLGPGVTIGEGSIVGAGALVLADVPARVLAFGSPARVVRSLEGAVNWRTILAGSAAK
jgi:sugar O-acyltransferase (sialic acid O-acetyltransferase NeuD family)